MSFFFTHILDIRKNMKPYANVGIDKVACLGDQVIAICGVPDKRVSLLSRKRLLLIDEIDINRYQLID